MTHDELLKRIESKFIVNDDGVTQAGSTEFVLRSALRAIVELHKPEHSHSGYRCTVCFIDTTYPCETIEAIEKELA